MTDGRLRGPDGGPGPVLWPLVLFLTVWGGLARLELARELPSSFTGWLARNPSTDLRTNLDRAARIREDPWLLAEPAPFYQAPLYPYVLALAGPAPTDGISVPRPLVLIDALIVPATYGLGRLVLGAGPGLMAAAIVAAYGPLRLHAVLPLSASLETLLGTLALLALLVAARRDHPRTWAMAGGVLGLASLARPNFLVLAALLVPLARGRPRPARWLAGRSAILLAVVVALHVPVLFRNLRVAGSWRILPTAGAENFRIGNSVDSAPGGFRYPSGEPHRIASRAFLELFVAKLAAFFNDYEWPQNVSFEFARRDLLDLHRDGPGLSLLLPLAFAGVLLVLVTGPAPARLVALATVLYAVSIALFFVVARFRLPAIPWMAVLAGALVRPLGPRPARAVTGRAAALLAGTLLAAGLSRWPERPIRFNDHGLVLGGLLFEADPHRVLAFLHEYLADYPDLAEPWYLRGRALMALDRPEEAAAAFRNALRCDPNHVPALEDMIRYHRTVDPDPERARVYEEALDRALGPVGQ